MDGLEMFEAYQSKADVLTRADKRYAVPLGGEDRLFEYPGNKMHVSFRYRCDLALYHQPGVSVFAPPVRYLSVPGVFPFAASQALSIKK